MLNPFRVNPTKQREGSLVFNYFDSNNFDFNLFLIPSQIKKAKPFWAISLKSLCVKIILPLTTFSRVNYHVSLSPFDFAARVILTFTLVSY